MIFDERSEGDYRIYAGALEAPRGQGYIAAVVVNRVRGSVDAPREAYRDDSLACGHRWLSPRRGAELCAEQGARGHPPRAAPAALLNPRRRRVRPSYGRRMRQAISAAHTDRCEPQASGHLLHQLLRRHHAHLVAVAQDVHAEFGAVGIGQAQFQAAIGAAGAFSAADAIARWPPITRPLR